MTALVRSRQSVSDDTSQMRRLRRLIRDVDRELVALLAARLKLGRRIGRLKIRLGLPVRDVAVEDRIMRGYLAACKRHRLSEDFGKTLAQRIIFESISVQQELLRRDMRNCACRHHAGE